MFQSDVVYSFPVMWSGNVGLGRSDRTVVYVDFKVRLDVQCISSASTRSCLSESQKMKSLIGLLGELLWAYLRLDGKKILWFLNI